MDPDQKLMLLVDAARLSSIDGWEGTLLQMATWDEATVRQVAVLLGYGDPLQPLTHHPACVRY